MFPQYGKWLQRERRMLSEGVGARIHRQPWIAGGDSVLLGIHELNGLGCLVQVFLDCRECLRSSWLDGESLSEVAA